MNMYCIISLILGLGQVLVLLIGINITHIRLIPIIGYDEVTNKY